MSASRLSTLRFGWLRWWVEVLLAVVASPLAVDDVEGDEDSVTRLVKVLYVLSSFRKATRNDYLDAHYSLQHQTHTHAHTLSKMPNT